MIKPDIENVKNTLRKYDFPVDIIIEVTSYCNLRCIMCPHPSLKRKKGEMKFEIFKKIVDEVAKENITARIWLAIMGEPLLIGNKIVEMVKYAKELGLEVHLNSNAEFLTEELARSFVNVQLDEIIIGLDANTKDTYEKIRVNGDFDKVIKNINKLIEIKKENHSVYPKIITQMIVMDENENELKDFKEYWVGMGTIVKIRPKLGWGQGVTAENLEKNNVERNFPCPWLTRTISIHWNGKVAQCDGDYEGIYSPGDINTQTIKQVWNGELKLRRDKHWVNDFNHELCSKCNDWKAGRSYFYYPKEGI